MTHISKVRKKEAEKVREQVFTYLEDNPGVKSADIQARFGMSPSTVWRHREAIRKGWRPEGWTPRQR